MSHLRTAAAAALCVVLAAPAFGGELEDGVAAINAAVSGSWVGTVNSIDPSTGAQTPIAYDFTVVVTSQDGLDFAYWGSQGLTMVDYIADAALKTRSWSQAGVLTEEEGVIALAEASPPESKVWTVSTEAPGPDGNPYAVVSTYSLTDSALSYTQEASIAGDASAPKVTLATGSWTRPQ